MVYFGYVPASGTQRKDKVRGVGFYQDEESKLLKKSTSLVDPLSNR